MATDSEILDGIENQFLVDGEQLATLRKYAAIARAVESGEWKLVPRSMAPEMVEAGEDALHDVLAGFMSHGAQVERLWDALIAAAPDAPQI